MNAAAERAVLRLKRYRRNNTGRSSAVEENRFVSVAARVMEMLIDLMVQ